MKSRLLQTALILFTFASVAPLYTNCAPTKSATSESAQSSDQPATSSCPTAPAGSSKLASIKDVVALINVLPKPLTLECFLENLSRPLAVNAVDNQFSAQPSAGPQSPRTFILMKPLVLSVVPAGSGRALLEMSELINSGESVKGELEFPITASIDATLPFSRITEGGGGTSCRSCHQGEAPAGALYPGSAFRNQIIRPSSFDRVSVSSLRTAAQSCDAQVDAYRCGILRAIFIDGRAVDTSFP